MQWITRTHIRQRNQWVKNGPDVRRVCVCAGLADCAHTQHLPAYGIRYLYAHGFCVCFFFFFVPISLFEKQKICFSKFRLAFPIRRVEQEVL